ncbi:MAG: stalk domain-containing protein [Bacillota bacterium]
MQLRFKLRNIVIGAVVYLIFTLILAAPIPGYTAENVKLVIDGKTIETSPSPILDSGRTLVPVRLVSEQLGAVVQWDSTAETVHIQKGSKSVLLRISNRFVDFQGGSPAYSLVDVAPKIIEGRTFVPLRLVSNALGVAINWDGGKRTVSIDSSLPVEFSPFFDMTLPSVQPGQTVQGLNYLQVHSVNGLPAEAAEVRFQLLNPQTGKGPVIARGNNVKGVYSWLPDPASNGQRVLAAGIYDQKGNILSGTVVPIQLAVNPQVTLTGINPEQVINNTVSLGIATNFLAQFVKYEITYLDTGKVVTTEEMDPQGTYAWTPQLTDVGNISFRALVYDRLGQVHASLPIKAKAQVERKLELRGAAAGKAIEKPVTLWVWRNFLITSADYLLKNVNTGEERVLAQFPSYSSFSWFPGPEYAGTWEVTARIKDTVGNPYTTAPVLVQVPSTAKLLIQTLAPNQVLTEPVKLKSIANVPLNAIEYRLLTIDNKVRNIIAGGNDSTAEYIWAPENKDVGSWKIQGVGTTLSGQKIYGEAIPIRVYLGTIHKPQPIIEKDKFLGFASNLAVLSQEKTGMSAALQTAQAILETGWGQQTPADKYSGQRSNNLFGIKGKGPAGSVTSNTWEEYNGNTFRVDAQFRAYSNPEESWQDHKNLLLTSARYQPYRDVMHNSTQGAWALKRTGYATDSKYPLKLMDIIKRYNLHLLDEKGI